MFNKPQQLRQRDPSGLRLQCSLKTVGDPTSWHWTTTSWQSLANLGNSCTFKTFWWYGGSFVVLYDFTLFDAALPWSERTTYYIQCRNWATGQGFSARSAALSKTLKPQWWSSCAASLYCYSSYSSLHFDWANCMKYHLPCVISLPDRSAGEMPFLRSELSPSGASFLASIRSSQALKLQRFILFLYHKPSGQLQGPTKPKHWSCYQKKLDLHNN